MGTTEKPAITFKDLPEEAQAAILQVVDARRLNLSGLTQYTQAIENLVEGTQKLGPSTQVVTEEVLADKISPHAKMQDAIRDAIRYVADVVGDSAVFSPLNHDEQLIKTAAGKLTATANADWDAMQNPANSNARDKAEQQYVKHVISGIEDIAEQALATATPARPKDHASEVAKK